MEQREESGARSGFPESRQRSTIGQGLVRVDVSFSSFLGAKEKDITFCSFFKKEKQKKGTNAFTASVPSRQ